MGKWLILRTERTADLRVITRATIFLLPTASVVWHVSKLERKKNKKAPCWFHRKVAKETVWRMKSTTYGSIYLFVLGWGEGVSGKFSALTTFIKACKIKSSSRKRNTLKVCIYYINANIFARFQSSGNIQLEWLKSISPWGFESPQITCNQKLPLDSRLTQFTQNPCLCMQRWYKIGTLDRSCPNAHLDLCTRNQTELHLNAWPKVLHFLLVGGGGEEKYLPYL